MKQIITIKYSKFLFLLVIVPLLFFSCKKNNTEENLPPKAKFTYTLGQSGGIVIFKNSSEEATEYYWEFGDGTTETKSDDIQFSHQYQLKGTYQVKLTASNDYGDDESSSTITVTTQPEGTACFYAAHSGGSFEPITVYVDGAYAGTITTFQSSIYPLPDCGLSGYAVISLPVGTHSYTAQSATHQWAAQNFTIDWSNCNRICLYE